MPTFGEVTGFPEYVNIELEWYTDESMTTAVDFGADGIVIDGSKTFVAAVTDKDIEVANSYVRPNADGWDRNRSGEKDADGNTITANPALKSDAAYGSAEALVSKDGYSDINVNYVGYIANTRRLDPEKDIYFSYTLDSKNESANDDDNNDGIKDPKHNLKYFYVGMFNSLTGALISQGQLHENRFGGFAVFGHRVNTEVQAGEGGGKLEIKTGGSSENNSFTYSETGKVDLKISVGTDSTAIFQKKNGNWVQIATMNVTRANFPDGVYMVLETTRVTWINARISQESVITQGAVSNGTLTIDTAEALSGLLAGERVYFTATPAAGYQFSEDGVLADGQKVNVEYDETEESYYFNMPFGSSEVTVKFAVPVTFMADGNKVGEDLLVLAGEKIDEFDVDDAPDKTGYTFDGWYADQALTQRFDFETTAVTGPITLYAKYTAASYTITFMDGQSKYQTSTATYGGKFTAPAAPEKEGYTFDGWYVDAAFSAKYDFDAAVSGNVTLYAKWTEVSAPPEEKKGCGKSAATAGGAAAAAVALVGAALVALRKKSV